MIMMILTTRETQSVPVQQEQDPEAAALLELWEDQTVRWEEAVTQKVTPKVMKFLEEVTQEVMKAQKEVTLEVMKEATQRVMTVKGEITPEVM